MGSTHREYWDIMGHRQVLRYLEFAVKRNHTVAAYLFCGPAQLGKTTVARLFLMRLLCKTPHGTAACGNCASCRSFIANTHPDAIIMDNDLHGSASENGSQGLTERIKPLEIESLEDSILPIAFIRYVFNP
jgi:DNA polymerase III gamma/tau subunit